MSHEQGQVEVLPPLTDMDFEKLPTLRISTPLVQLQELFDKIAGAQNKALVWAKNTVIDNGKARDEARMLRKHLKDTINTIEKKRLELMAPVRAYDKELIELCREVCSPFEESIKLLDEKGIAYANECKRREDEQKAEALALQRAEEERIQAERRERQAEEERQQAIEAEKVRKIREQAEKEAKANGDKMTAKLQADEAAKAEAARIEKERAERQRIEDQRQAEERRREDEMRAKTANDMSKASAAGKTKGVKKIWVIEVVDQNLIPRQFMTYDPSKAKKYMDAGLSQETDPLKHIPGLRCYSTLSASGR